MSSCDPFADDYNPVSTIPELPPPSDQWNIPPADKVAAPASAIPTIEDAFVAARKSYQEYEDAVARLAVEENAATGDRIALEAARMSLLANTDPATMGKNEEQRKAWMYDKFGNAISMQNARLRSVELLKSEAEICRIRCRWHDNVLRYLELTAWKEDDYA